MCSHCRWAASGRVTAAATGAPLAGAQVMLQRRVAGGDWEAIPAATVRPTANPLQSDPAGRFTWLVGGAAGDEVRVLVSLQGYATAASAPRKLREDGALDVALVGSGVPADGDDGAHDPTLPGVPSTPDRPVGGAGGPTTPKPPVKPVVKGCAARKGKTKAACLRAEKLAKALKACKAQKGPKRKTCERRARALSACEAKTGTKRTACRKKALAIGTAKTKATKKHKATKKSHRR